MFVTYGSFFFFFYPTDRLQKKPLWKIRHSRNQPTVALHRFHGHHPNVKGHQSLTLRLPNEGMVCARCAVTSVSLYVPNARGAAHPENARTALWNPYPQWHKICETLPLLAQFLTIDLHGITPVCLRFAGHAQRAGGPDKGSHPVKMHSAEPESGPPRWFTSIMVKKSCDVIWCIFGPKSIPLLAQILKKGYPLLSNEASTLRIIYTIFIRLISPWSGRVAITQSTDWNNGEPMWHLWHNFLFKSGLFEEMLSANLVQFLTFWISVLGKP